MKIINNLKKVFVIIISLIMIFNICSLGVAKADEVSDAGLINFDILKDEDGNWLDYEDLDTSEQIDAYNKLHHNTDEPALMNAKGSLRSKIDNGESGNVKANLKYSISGLLKDRVIQSFFVIGDVMYVTQAVKEEDAVYIYKCDIDTEKNIATVKETMIIIGAGHGTTLAVYKYNGRDYLLVCAKSKKIDEQIYTIQIGRTEFRSGKINATDIKRFCNCNYANDSNTTCGELKQVVANLSTDNKIIYFRVEDVDGNLVYTAYPMSVFNKQLDNALGNLVSFKDNDTMRKAALFTIKQNKDNALTPNRLFQGTDITNGKNIYIVSGNESETSKPLIISRMNSLGGNIESYKINMPIVNYNPSQRWEAEGVQIVDSKYLYVGMSPKSNNTIIVSKKVAYIFAIMRP